MRATTYLFSIVLCLLSLSMEAQDLRFSQFFASPHTLNPALTGVINGDYRLGANFRSQWGNFNPFTTYSFFADAPILAGRLNGDFVGVGFAAYKDFIDITYDMTQLSFSGSYNKLLSTRPYQYLTFGVQLSYAQWNMNTNEHRFGTVWTDGGSNFDPIVNGTAASISYGDLGVGLMWYSRLNDNFDIYTGLALAHIARPNLAFSSGPDYRLPIRTTLHAGAQVRFGGAYGLLPGVMVLSQGPSFETNVGTYFKVELSSIEDNQTAFYVGPWYRIVGHETRPISSDAFVLATRLDIVGISLGFSYDVNISDLTVLSSNNGGPELSLIYVGELGFVSGGHGGSNSRNCPRF